MNKIATTVVNCVFLCLLRLRSSFASLGHGEMDGVPSELRSKTKAADGKCENQSFEKSLGTPRRWGCQKIYKIELKVLLWAKSGVVLRQNWLLMELHF